MKQCGEMFSILRHFNALRLSADDVYTVGLKSVGEVERCLAAKLHNGRPTFFMFVNVENVFERERFEIKFVARVVIGGNRLRIRIDHDGFESFFLQRERRVHTTVIELDPLTDPIRSAAEYHDFLSFASAGLVFVAVGRIVIRRVGFELGRARVDEPISWEHALGGSCPSAVRLRSTSVR